MRIAGRHAIGLRDANGVRRSTYKARKYRGHRTAIETKWASFGAILCLLSGRQMDPDKGGNVGDRKAVAQATNLVSLHS